MLKLFALLQGPHALEASEAAIVLGVRSKFLLKRFLKFQSQPILK